MKSKSTTAILALFLGGLGIHRFYLGQNIAGLLYLVFCWTFIPALISIFDFFIFIFMSESRFNIKYNLKTGF
ncbi:TM2 domain-containing protein [Chryseobacterium sp. MMS23-Vi53]|uniref:TM2 domain-containing protein n=1 Tax=Chryseobacterium sp. MMS23-Vi53 TaxID=3386644 RepID=UPI0039E9656D